MWHMARDARIERYFSQTPTLLVDYKMVIDLDTALAGPRPI